MNSVNNNRSDAKLLKELTTQHLNTEITGLIISAGLSQRMRKFKPLLHFSGKSFLKNVTGKLSKVCKEIIIVTGYNAKLIEEHIADWEENLQKKIKFIYNANYERGMFTSLKIGVEQCNTNWLLYHFVDQPNLPQNFYTEFTKASSNNCDWLQPMFNSRKGHPILFNKKVMKIITNSDDNSNLRNITTERIINKKYWNCNYHEILSDFDTPEDLVELSLP